MSCFAINSIWNQSIKVSKRYSPAAEPIVPTSLRQSLLERENDHNGEQVNRKSNVDKRPLSLAPLSFDEVITDILKIKPEPKQPKKRPNGKEAGK